MAQQMEAIPDSMNFNDNGELAVNATSLLARYDSVNGVSFAPTGANIIRIRIVIMNKRMISFKFNFIAIFH